MLAAPAGIADELCAPPAAWPNLSYPHRLPTPPRNPDRRRTRLLYDCACSRQNAPSAERADARPHGSHRACGASSMSDQSIGSQPGRPGFGKLGGRQARLNRAECNEIHDAPPAVGKLNRVEGLERGREATRVPRMLQVANVLGKWGWPTSRPARHRSAPGRTPTGRDEIFATTYGPCRPPLSS